MTSVCWCVGLLFFFFCFVGLSELDGLFCFCILFSWFVVVFAWWLLAWVVGCLFSCQLLGLLALFVVLISWFVVYTLFCLFSD